MSHQHRQRNGHKTLQGNGNGVSNGNIERATNASSSATSTSSISVPSIINNVKGYLSSIGIGNVNGSSPLPSSSSPGASASLLGQSDGISSDDESHSKRNKNKFETPQHYLSDIKRQVVILYQTQGRRKFIFIALALGISLILVMSFTINIIFTSDDVTNSSDSWFGSFFFVSDDQNSQLGDGDGKGLSAETEDDSPILIKETEEESREKERKRIEYIKQSDPKHSGSAPLSLCSGGSAIGHPPRAVVANLMNVYEKYLKTPGINPVILINAAASKPGPVRNNLQTLLAKIESSSHAGWNVSDAKVLPLGQAGYVRRDLPVYKNALDYHGFTVLSRAEGGFLELKQTESRSLYSAILCLSFNTDHCLRDPNKQHPKIGLDRKINRISGLRDVVWSKHKFCQTISSSIRGIDDPELKGFTFPCWVMPQDYDTMIADSKNRSPDLPPPIWIVKPRSLGAGMGISIVDSIAKLKKEQNKDHVIQDYLQNPHLIEQPEIKTGKMGKFKWDLRSYVLVTSVVPLRAYVYGRGLVRVATTPYSNDCKNATQCLTNTSINKHVEGAKLKDITWSLQKLRKYLEERKENYGMFCYFW